MRAREFVEDVQKLKGRIIKSLSKKPEMDPIFSKVYKVLVGEPISTRIKNYITARRDKDAIAAIEYLDDIIPALGTVEEVKQFLDDFKKSNYDFISIEKLCPPNGMSSASHLSDIVDNKFGKKLFDKLSSGYRGKNDAGPGEAALAVLSPNITYAQGASTEDYGKGGDIIVQGVGKVEVKGGKGGRLVGRVNINQDGMATVLGGYLPPKKVAQPKVKKSKKIKQPIKPPVQNAPLSTNAQSAVDRFVSNLRKDQPEPDEPLNEDVTQSSISATWLSSPLPPEFPKEEFMRAATLSWFGEVRDDLVKAAGTPGFRRLWLNSMFELYKEYAGWSGILFLSHDVYQYAILGDQIPDNYVSSWGLLYYPKSKQSRDMCPQIVPRL